MANEFNEIDFGKYEFDAHMVADFLNIMSEETQSINDTHEIGVESAELHFDKRRAIPGGSRTENFLKSHKLSEEILFDLIELCSNQEFLEIHKKDLLEGKDYGRDNIHFFAVQDAGKQFIANHKK